MPPSYDAYHSCCVTVATVLQPRPIRRQLCDTLICFIAKQRMEEQAQTTAYEDKKKKRAFPHALHPLRTRTTVQCPGCFYAAPKAVPSIIYFLRSSVYFTRCLHYRHSHGSKKWKRAHIEVLHSSEAQRYKRKKRTKRRKPHFLPFFLGGKRGDSKRRPSQNALQSTYIHEESFSPDPSFLVVH